MRVSDLKRDMDERFVDLKKDVDERFVDLKKDVDQRFVDLKKDMDERFAQVDQRFLEMQRQIAVEGEATRRHFDVVAEQGRSDVRTTLDKVMAIGERVDRSEGAHARESEVVTQVLDDHEVRLKAMEKRRR